MLSLCVPVRRQFQCTLREKTFLFHSLGKFKLIPQRGILESQFPFHEKKNPDRKDSFPLCFQWCPECHFPVTPSCQESRSIEPYIPCKSPISTSKSNYTTAHRFCRQRYVLTNHICGCIRIVTVFVENETHSSLIRMVGKLLSCRHASCTCLILCRRAGRRHCTFAISCPMSLSTTTTTFGFRFRFFQ